MTEIIKQLNINGHPRDCNNYSLVCAGNVKLTHDKHAITNEESIANNSVITTAIGNYNIIGIIPTSTDLIIFTNKDNGTIYRYKEKENTCVQVNNKWKWSGGKIKGTYTTNVKNELIIAVAEYDKHELCPSSIPTYNGDVPLKIINIDNINDIFPAHVLSYAIAPIVLYCVASKFDFIPGYSYKGYYEFYVRYKISTNNYTQWFLINGKPLVDVTELKDITTFIHPDLIDEQTQSTDKYKYITNGHFDFISDDSDFCNICLKLDLNFISVPNSPNYSKYQIAYVVSSKTYNKCYKSNDIDINKTTYIVNPKAEEEYSSDELILDYYNYYNVKQITNYKNRIYIADYKEHSANPKTVNTFVNSLQVGGAWYNPVGSGSDEGGGSGGDEEGLDTKYDFNLQYGDAYGHTSEGYLIDYDSSRNYNLDVINIDGIDYFLFPLAGLIGDDGSGHASGSCVADVSLTNNTTVQISGLMLYIAFKCVTSGFVDSNSNLLLNYTGASIINKYTVSEVDYFDINPHASQYNRFRLHNFGGLVTEVLAGTSSGHNGTSINNSRDGNDISVSKDILNNFLLPDEVYNFYINFVDKYGHISTGIRLNPATITFNSTYFSTYTNDNGLKLIRTKMNPPLCGVIPKLVLNNNTAFPSDFIACFLSYRKFDKSNKLHGLIYDEAKFTNGYINYDDEPNIGINKYKTYYSTNTFNNLIYNLYRSNKKFVSGVVRNKTTVFNFAVTNSPSLGNGNVYPGLVVANDAVADNVGRESHIWLNQDSGYNNILHTPKLRVYANDDAILTGKKYMGDDKIIIPTAAIADYNRNIYDNKTGYNGFLSFDSSIIYSDKAFMLSQVDGKIKDLVADIVISNKYEDDGTTSRPATDPYMCYIFSHLWDYPLHVRRFKNQPKVTSIVPDVKEETTHPITGEVIVKGVDGNPMIQTLVEPKDSIDLYKYPHPNKSDIGSFKTLIAYDENTLDVTEYQKTIRRSNVLGDETEEIGWRRFPVEGYKNITENKGKITNIIGLGHYFFAHTEHSLFVFDIDSAIHAEDKDIQMYQPDVFEVDYKEVFTSDKGYGGLQDDLAWCVGEFGYIFYNNDFNRFYRFDNDKLAYIDESIVNYLLNKKPTNVRFGIDKFNSRLLICFTDDSRKTLSYDYELGSFISWHNYSFIQAFNTKTKIYYLHNNYANIANYIENEFGNFVNYATNPYIPYGVSNNNCKFGIDIIVNTEYDALKMLEFINYDCRKEKVAIDNNEYQDRNYRYHPYSGNILRIYNEDCDTNEMDITVDSSANFNKLNNYKKPWYELARWNFNYFRDKITTNPATNPSDKLRRIHGKYFIFKFIFNRDATKRVEFEGLDCKFSSNR